MGYQPHIKSSRASGRGGGKALHEKSKAKGRQHRSSAGSKQEERQIATAEEVSERTLKRLHILGIQKFGSSPFSEHFGRWLGNLTDVLSEFESSQNLTAEDQFVKKCSKILSVVELQLKERSRKEATVEANFRSLTEGRHLLERIKKEYVAQAKEIRKRKNNEVKRLNSNIDRLRIELDEIARMKTGLFRGISKKAKEEKEAETAQRLNMTQRELELAMLDFTLAIEKLRSEYERNMQPVINQIKKCQKNIENLETDGSLEDRWFACEALIDAVNALLQRKMLQLH